MFRFSLLSYIEVLHGRTNVNDLGNHSEILFSGKKKRKKEEGYFSRANKKERKKILEYKKSGKSQLFSSLEWQFIKKKNGCEITKYTSSERQMISFPREFKAAQLNKK